MSKLTPANKIQVKETTKKIVVPGPTQGFKNGVFLVVCEDYRIIDLVFSGEDAEQKAISYAEQRNSRITDCL